MGDLEIINQHIDIRETIGYEALSDVELCDLPGVLHFLKIVNNYQRMVRIEKNKKK